MTQPAATPMRLALVSAVMGALGALGAGILLLNDSLAESAVAWVLTVAALLIALVALVAWWRQGPGSRRPNSPSPPDR